MKSKLRVVTMLGFASFICMAIGVWRASAAVTNSVVFLETMATNAVKPWTGTGCNYQWTVAFNAGNPFEQNVNANYAGNPCGLSFKSGTTDLTDSTITTAQTINALGNSGTVDFYLQIPAPLTTNSFAGWALQLNPGTGVFTTRLSGQSTNGQGWTHYVYALQSSELVSNLTLRFQFNENATGNRIFLDNISVTVQTGASNAVIPFTAQYVRIPGGNFLMGDQFGYIDIKHYTDEVPVHNVYISPLYMDTTLVTCREYCDYLNAALAQGLIMVSNNVAYAVGGTNEYFYTHDASSSSRIQYQNGAFVVLDSRDLHPVTSVRWFGAIAYCNWLSQTNGFNACYNLTNGDADFSQNGWRLPTEAEWEYAAHGGQTNPYVMFPWGMNTNADGSYANWENSGDPFETTNDYPCTTPVAFYNGALRYATNYNWPGSQTTYQTSDGSNPYGLYDMGGNVWEWCNDWYMNNYYAYCTNNNVVTNPPGPALAILTTNDYFNGSPYRCLRGGTWWNGNSASDFDYGHARVSNRDPSYFLGGGPPGDPYGQWSQTGFRVMRQEKISQTVGLFTNLSGVQPGYTLFSPMQANTTYLINNAGQYVHQWTTTYNPGRSEYLMPNGHLLRTCSLGSQSQLNTGGGEGGRLEERDWQNNLVWCYVQNTTTNMTHHDIALLPNGNVLMILCEKKTLAEVLAAGFQTNSQTQTSVTTNGGFLLPDAIIEVQPVAKDGTTNGTIVWEWHVWDHLVQQYDASKNNYGVVSSHPELINANSGALQQFWNHFNGIDYNAQFDQILISSRNQSEIWVIDHSTTTAQAAGHSGGRYGKGGDLLYRWGNPAINNLTDATHKEMLWQQHCATWIPTNCPGAGHILIHDNGINRANPAYTSIDEIAPPVDANGFYTNTGNAYFGPTNYFWQYTNNPATNFFGADIGGAQRQPNGDTLITFGIRGTVFEVTSNAQTVWKYINPVTTTPLAQGVTVPFDPNSNTNFPLQTLNEVFKVHRYATNFSGFVGKDLTPRGTIETYTGAATDTVGLGLPDIWVRAHFGTLSAVTATSSHSGNGLTDIQEFQCGLDPNVWSSANDGIPDGWAIQYGFDPTLASVASMINSNGNTTLQNYTADLNPTNAASQFAFIGMTVSNNAVQFGWIGGVNATQYLLSASTLTATQWNVIFTNVPPTSITNYLVQPAGRSNLFYRIRAER
jgi:formylglycine-generating enzyme required for sulfatase activity